MCIFLTHSSANGRVGRSPKSSTAKSRRFSRLLRDLKFCSQTCCPSSRLSDFQNYILLNFEMLFLEACFQNSEGLEGLKEYALIKKVIGLMKDELGGKIMTEFIELRPKLYAYRKLNDKENKRCKGMKKCMVKRRISFDDYKKYLFDAKSKSIHRSELMFRNEKYEVHTVEVNKVP